MFFVFVVRKHDLQPKPICEKNLGTLMRVVHVTSKMNATDDLQSISDRLQVVPGPTQCVRDLTNIYKVVIQYIRTPMDAIADQHGVIDLAKLKWSEAYTEMLEKGWSWKIFQWQVGETWPQAADIIQRALNASHSVGASMSELEVAVTISDHVVMQIAQGLAANFEAATNEALGANPQCAGYANKLSTLVELYGGGAGAPVIRKLDDFAKKYAANRRMGEEFVSAVVDVKFSTTRAFPLLRSAMIATNLTASKVVDGVARLLTKSDVLQMSSLKKRGDVERLEDELARVDAAVSQLRSREFLKHSQQIELEGRFMVRACAHIAGKGKQTFEKVDYSSIDEVLFRFLEELIAAVSKNRPDGHAPISCISGKGGIGAASNSCWEREVFAVIQSNPSWETVVEEQSKAAEKKLAKSTIESAEKNKKVEATGPLTTDQVSAPQHAAKAKGFAVGTFVVEKGLGQKHGVYIIVDMGEKVVLKEFDEFKSAHLTVTIPVATMIEKWAPYKGDMAEKVKGQWADRLQTDLANQRSLDLDKAKCDFYIALLSYSRSQPSNLPKQIYLCCKPTAVRAAANIAKGELVIVPIGPMSTITIYGSASSVNTGHSIKIGEDVHTFSINRTAQPKGVNVAEWGADDTINPAWWVGTTSVQDDANVAWKTVTYGEVKIPVLTNAKPIKKDTLIQLFKVAITKRPLEGANVVSTPVAKAKAKP